MHRAEPTPYWPDTKEDLIEETRVCLHCNNWSTALGCWLVYKGLIEFKCAADCGFFTRGFEEQF
jgi:hypothetical protein